MSSGCTSRKGSSEMSVISGAPRSGDNDGGGMSKLKPHIPGTTNTMATAGGANLLKQSHAVGGNIKQSDGGAKNSKTHFSGTGLSALISSDGGATNLKAPGVGASTFKAPTTGTISFKPQNGGTSSLKPSNVGVSHLKPFDAAFSNIKPTISNNGAYNLKANETYEGNNAKTNGAFCGGGGGEGYCGELDSGVGEGGEFGAEGGGTTPGLLLCGLCRQRGVVSRCHDCTRFLCSQCRLTHVEIPACSDHVLEDLTTYTERQRQSLQDVIEGYIAIVCDCEQQAADLARYFDHIKVIKRHVLEKIQESAFMMHEHVTKCHQSLVDLVQNVTTEEHRNIDRKLLELQKACGQVVNKTTILGSVVDSEALHPSLTDQAFVDEVRTEYLRDCPLYEARLTKLCVPETRLQMHFRQADKFHQMLEQVRLDVEQQEWGDQHDVHTTHDTLNADTLLISQSDVFGDSGDAPVIVDGRQAVSQSGEGVEEEEDAYPRSLSDLIDTPLEVTRMYQFPQTVRRIAMVNRELWAVVSDGTILVLYSESGTMRRTVRIRELNPDPAWWQRLLREDTHTLHDCIAVVQCNREVIMCLSKLPGSSSSELSGLHTQIMQITRDGLVVNKMVPDTYTDICADGGVFYALLSGAPNKLEVFRSDGATGSSYLHMRTVMLESGRTYYRLLACAGVVYTTGLRHEVHRYHMETGHRYTHGTHGVALAGELDTPKLCCSDDYGVVLVADSQNHRLQLLDRHKQWHVLDTQRKLTCPWDATWRAPQAQLFFVDCGSSIGSNVLYKLCVARRPIVISAPNIALEDDGT